VTGLVLDGTLLDALLLSERVLVVAGVVLEGTMLDVVGWLCAALLL